MSIAKNFSNFLFFIFKEMNTQVKVWNDKEQKYETQITVYKGKGRTYITKAGEVKHYDTIKKYTPRVKKFDILLNNPDIQNILKDKDKKVIDRVDDVYNISLKVSENKFTYQQIKQFVYRNAEKQSLGTSENKKSVL